jgi:CRP-like cAMP-binding protein
MYISDEGASTEIAVVGHEGVVGVALYDGERATCCAMVQTAGYAYRLKTSVLRTAFKQGGPLAQVMFRYTSALLAQIAQNVVASRHCSIEQKLSRWLLERADRSLSSEIKVTQDTIAAMLGVRRESVTVAASKLQEEGLIQYRRGTVEVLDRAGLELYAGSCYKAARAGFDQLQNLSSTM